jgi:hypothetical protein
MEKKIQERKDGRTEDLRSTAIYSIAYRILLRPLPFPDPDRLVVLRQVNHEGRQMRFSRANFADVEHDTRAFAGMARFSSGLAAVVGGTDPVRVTTTLVSARFFDVIGVAPARGRRFSTSETTEGGPPAAIISHALWRQHFAGRADVVGETLRIDSETHPIVGDLRTLTVVGVVADVRDAGHEGPAAPTVYANAIQRTNAVSAFTFVVRGPADPLSLATDVRAVIRAVAPDVPVTTRPVDDVVASTYGPQRFSLVIVLGFALSALLLAVFGVYGVSSYAVASRTREFGVRMVLGADRRSILSQVLREGLWLIGAGTVAGVAGAMAVTRVVASLVRDLGTPSAAIVAGGIVLLGLSALLACALPARRAASIEPGAALREP